jgi:hypothetical protein
MTLGGVQVYVVFPGSPGLPDVGSRSGVPTVNVVDDSVPQLYVPVGVSEYTCPFVAAIVTKPSPYGSPLSANVPWWNASGILLSYVPVGVPVTVLLASTNVFASFDAIEYVPESRMYTSVAVPISKLDPFGSVSVVDVGVRFSMESLLEVS